MKDGQFIRSGPVSFQQASANRKFTNVADEAIPGSRFRRPVRLAPYCSATYVSIATTCPKGCPFKDKGCYVQAGIAGEANRKLDAAAVDLRYTGDDVIAWECRVIDEQWPDGIPQDGFNGRGRDLRLHVGGDVSSKRAATWLAAAADRWRARGGGAVWTYTHRWRQIPRSAWGSIRVFASVETLSEARRALKRGYPPAMTVLTHKTDKVWKPHPIHALRIVPCPAQTRGRNCVNCRLCLDRQLEGPTAIAFELHGRRFRGDGRRLPVARAAR